MLTSDGITAVYIYFYKLAVLVEEERVLLDLPALMASVGGFVGMLLGWSALDLVRLLSATLERGLRRSRSQAKHP